MDKTNKIRRNILIYIIGVYSLSVTGGVITAGGNGVGGLVFMIDVIS
jgi:hypothetical protein